MVWTRQRPERRNKSSLNRRSEMVRQSIFRPACESNSGWPTEGRATMRKYVVTGILALVSSGMGNMAAAAVSQATEQARTMEQVVDRVVASENKLNNDIRKYSPLVETYIQNLKPDK